MSNDTVDGFIAERRRIAGEGPEPADCVLAIAPLMLKLLRGNRASISDIAATSALGDVRKFVSGG